MLEDAIALGMIRSLWMIRGDRGDFISVPLISISEVEGQLRVIIEDTGRHRLPVIDAQPDRGSMPGGSIEQGCSVE